MTSTSNPISLPQGGGAISGIGEKFSPDLFTGTGNFSVPITLPPGRNGFQPTLALSYSTGNGNSPFGMGWSLSVPGISRKTSKGVPRYQGNDTFILSGAEDLVPTEKGDSNEFYYRPRTEGLFAKIIRQSDSENDYWKVSSKDGLVSTYGTPKSKGSDPATIANPENKTQAFAWNLTETMDPFGNVIQYGYSKYPSDPEVKDPKKDEFRPYDQLYLTQIKYVDYEDQGSRKFLVTVNFRYEKLLEKPESSEDRRHHCYPSSDYRSGFEICTSWRCKAIEIYTNPEGLTKLTPAQKVRSYDLTYLDELSDKELAASKNSLPLNAVSFLHKIEVTGYDGDKTEKMPAPRFGYSQFNPEKRDFYAVKGSGFPAQSLRDPNLELIDLFGNGLPDLLETQGTTRYWRNLGNGTFDLPREMRNAPAGIQLADTGVQVADIAGDGRPDLLVATQEDSGYFRIEHEGTWDRRSFRRFPQSSSFSLKDPNVQMVDLDGDGISDVIRSGDRFELFLSHSKKGWNDSFQVHRKDLANFPDVNFSDPRVKWADMSGDGLSDILLVHDGNIEYWPYMGYGNWGKRIHMHNSPRFPGNYDPNRVLIGDVDGDGVADMIYIDHCHVILWVNQCGRGWSDPIIIEGTPPITNPAAIRLVDLNGTGIGGLLWTRDQNSNRDHYYFLDFTGGSKPYLLNEMDNQMGAITRVEYQPSTRFYLEDEIRPESRWQTTLPFPVQVVSRVEVYDQISKGKLTTEYSYHHGYWDGEEREFRGFGRVDQRDSESFEAYHNESIEEDLNFRVVDHQYFSAATETRSWFHQGATRIKDGDWQATDYRHEYWSEDQSLLEWIDDQQELLKTLPPQHRRDGLRSLRGNVLRSELYALDQSKLADKPYTVSESIYGLREEKATAQAEGATRIFFPHQLGSRTTQWERGDDPMTQFSFTKDFDQYGQPRKQLQVACPRGWKDLQSTARNYLFSYGETQFADSDDKSVYIVDRVAETRNYEVRPTAEVDIQQLVKSIDEGNISRKLLGHLLNFYDGLKHQGLENGKLGSGGKLMRSEMLVLTEEILQKVHEGTIPSYFQTSGPPGWSAEYPPEFLNSLPQQNHSFTRTDLTVTALGYGFAQGNTGPYQRGFYVATERQEISANGLIVSTLDSLGNQTNLQYDQYDLFPIAVTDPAGLTTKAEYDYRLLQPFRITDPNQNRSEVVFSPLGLTERIYVRGKEDEKMGDRLRQPSTRFQFDFFAFQNSRQQDPDHPQPVFVHTIQRTDHAWDLINMENERRSVLGQSEMSSVEIENFFENEFEQHPERFVQTREYSDGLGRLIQSRAQAEDVLYGDAFFGNGTLPLDQDDPVGTRATVIGKQASHDPNVRVNGWQTINNKGKPVEQFEPSYHTGWDYLDRSEAVDQMLGQKITMYYDPRGQVIRTVNPDSSEQRVIYGIPKDLDDPNDFEPTPWEAYTYDTNDNAGQTHPNTSISYLHHWNTPASLEIDSLGRTIKTIERTRDNPADPVEEIITQSSYDILGNLVEVKDAFGRSAFNYAYSVVPETPPIGIVSIDAGTRKIIVDATGQEVERRDGKGSLILQSYDGLIRPTQIWARDKQTDAVKLRQKLIYGDQSALTEDQKTAGNYKGNLFQHYDEAGRITIDRYDFKGNATESTRQVINHEQLVSVYIGASTNNWVIEAFQVDWQQPEDSLLDAKHYSTSSEFDALNRPARIVYPEDVDGRRSELVPTYNRAGALEQVTLDAQTYVNQITYNARGQRTLVAYGDGLMTRYGYDEQTFRLKRLRTEKYTFDQLNFQPQGTALQDFVYEYDLAGNILKIKDRTPGSGIPNSVLGLERLDRIFEYDPLYRLRLASGRECDQAAPSLPWLDEPSCQDPTRTRAYTRRYQYDKMGNLEQLHHQTVGQGSSFNRIFTLQTELVNNQTRKKNNRLRAVNFAGATFHYAYDDANGSMTQEGDSRHFQWNHSDQLKSFSTQTQGAEPSIHAQYLYDGSGQRVMKLVRKQGGKLESRIYIGEMFEHFQWDVDTGNPIENNLLHVMDDQQRIAMIRRGAAHPDDRGPVIQFHLEDHLGSSNVVVDENGSLVNREENYPYGETSFGSFKKKRYRFTGKERDEESGLNYHGARYYGSWILRWINADPIGPHDDFNLFIYVNGFVLIAKDLEGTSTNLLETLRTFAKEDLDLVRNELEGMKDEIDRVRTKINNLQHAIEIEEFYDKFFLGEVDDQSPSKVEKRRLMQKYTDKLGDLNKTKERLEAKVEKFKSKLDDINNKLEKLRNEQIDKITLKSFLPDIALLGFSMLAENNRNEASKIRSSTINENRMPSERELRINELQGWKFNGLKDGKPTWRYDPDFGTKIRDMYLDFPKLQERILKNLENDYPLRLHDYPNAI